MFWKSVAGTFVKYAYIIGALVKLDPGTMSLVLRSDVMVAFVGGM